METRFPLTARAVAEMVVELSGRSIEAKYILRCTDEAGTIREWCPLAGLSPRSGISSQFARCIRARSPPTDRSDPRASLRENGSLPKARGGHTRWALELFP